MLGDVISVRVLSCIVKRMQEIVTTVRWLMNPLRMGRVIIQSQRPLPNNTKHPQQTDNPSPWWDSNPQSPQASGPWDRQYIAYWYIYLWCRFLVQEVAPSNISCLTEHWRRKAKTARFISRHVSCDNFVPPFFASDCIWHSHRKL